jgi:hypothetical protein
VNVLDENIPRDQKDLLGQWRVRFRAIPQDIGSQGLSDDNIPSLLLRLKQPTFLTRDKDFFLRELVHARCALVWFDVATEETAFFIRMFLDHPSFRTNSQRLGKVIQVQSQGLSFWTKKSIELIHVGWS